MDPSRDNPIFRFKAFWWALGLFALFTGALLIVGLANRRPSTSLEDAAAVARLEKRAKSDAAQREKLQVAPATVFPQVGKQLLAERPAAVEKPEQAVPGSPTQLKTAATTAAPTTPATPAAPAQPGTAPQPETPKPEAPADPAK